MIFLAEESLSVANIHYLNRRMSMRPMCIFIIKNGSSETEENDATAPHISHYTPLYRNQSVESMLSVINEQMEQLNNMRNIMIQPCSTMTRSTNNLTRRETEILRYLARGISNGGVARFLQISEKTVSAHKRNIMSKLNMIRPAELNYWLIQEGWCESIRTVDQFH
ncbi:helix-turn-helix transcriptional regulator [Erwinia sorbitola]|nr:LuxR C-terminal-related transcriptional regulator [Erwinia sorbitola]